MAEEKIRKAARDGYLDLLREATKRDLNAADEDGMTATMWAARYGNLDALRMIVGRGGDPDRCDLLGSTSLHFAARNGHMNCVSFLQNYGCNIWAMDNEYHSAMDIAALHDKEEIVKFLDDIHSRQLSLNPKVVQNLKERALKEADRNAKKYERVQADANRKAEREAKRLESLQDDFKAPTKQSFIKTLTQRMKGSNRNHIHKGMQGRAFSDFVGTSSGGAKRRILQKKQSEDSSSISEFHTSDMDDSGNRTFRSMSGIPGIQKGSDIYLTSRGDNTDDTGVRPALANVFPHTKGDVYRSKSESDLLDSGIDSLDSAQEDGEQPGLFCRPGGMGLGMGIGKISFLNNMQPALSNMFHSVPHSALDEDDIDGPMVNGINGDITSEDGATFKRHSSGSDSIGTAGSLSDRMKEFIPWKDDEVDFDDDEETEFTPLVLFLESCGLTNYTHLFTKEKIDLSALKLLDENDLKGIGLELGPRKKLLRAVEKREKVLHNPIAMTDTYL